MNIHYRKQQVLWGLKRLFQFLGVELIYTGFASIYDRLMNDINYVQWVDFIEDIFCINNIKPKLVLDLGCGTGSFCLEMAERGYEMIGIDQSVEMLSCARMKAIDKGLDILYLNQDMTSFDLYGTVDVIVCLMDSINYVTSKKALDRLFRLAANYLNPNGLFIFDINSRYKLETILGNNIFYSIEDDISYIWQNRYDGKKRTCEFDLTFFVKDKDCYRRHDEVHLEKAYTKEEMVKIVLNSNMVPVSIYDGLSLQPPVDTSERIFFICKKPHI